MHIMKDSLQIEQSQFEKQDSIYRKLFLNNPHRIDYEKFPDIQRADIDLVIKNRSNKPVRISEKYRPYDYGDILFEVWSVYPNKKGWVYETKADILAYWFPARVVIIEIQKVREIFENNGISMKTTLPEKTRQMTEIEIEGNIYKPYLISAKNEGYVSLSLAFSLGDLDKLGIKYSVINL